MSFSSVFFVDVQMILSVRTLNNNSFCPFRSGKIYTSVYLFAVLRCVVSSYSIFFNFYISTSVDFVFVHLIFDCQYRITRAVGYIVQVYIAIDFIVVSNSQRISLFANGNRCF